MKNWFRKRSTVLQPPMPSGRHSLRLALEPRLVFDAAALAPIPDQAALAGAKPGHHDGPVPAAPADAPAEAAPQGQPHDLAAPDFAALYAAPVRGDGSRPDAPLPPPAAVTEAAAAQAPAGTDARPDASRTPVFDAQADAQADGRAAGSPADRNLSGNDSQAAASAGRVVAVVDSSLEGWRTLADDLSAKAQVVVVGAEGTDLAGVARALASGGPVDSLQIFAHGSAGTVHLGGETIDAAALDGPLGQMVRDWSASLSQSGDILVFGCDVGAGDQGAAFVDKLAALTGADVAASTDAVGRGDFGLERTAGAVESGLALSERDAAGYDRLLAAPTIAQNVIYDANSRVTPEDTVLAITDVTVADADGGTLTVTLAATHGKVQVTTTGGLTVTGNNSASLTLSGSVASLNASLATLKYAPDADYNSQAGAASIAMTVNDGATTTNKTLNVEVTPVNDPSGLTLNPVSVNEGQTNVTLTAAALNVTDASKAFNMLDPDNVDQQIMFVIDALPTKGTLTLNGLPVDVGSNLSYADLLAGKFKYSANGSNVAAGDTDSFALNLQDGAGGSTLHRVLTINLQPVNDAPTVSGSAVVYEG